MVLLKGRPTRAGKVWQRADEREGTSLARLPEFLLGAEQRPITVAGAGAYGLWQAWHLASLGYRVRLIDKSQEPLSTSASRYAGTMLSPYCEAEASAKVVLEYGLQALALWRQAYPGLLAAGTLVVASARDRSELEHFARMTEGYETCDAKRIGVLEPDLGERFPAGLHYPDEAHMVTADVLTFLLTQVRRAGAEVLLGVDLADFAANVAEESGLLIDCRGMGARQLLSKLRGVRGERLILRTREVSLKRPVRLLHPRHPIYVVPWSHGEFMVGATVIESEDDSPVSVRSMLELLGTAYTLHAAFAEAEIVESGAGVRPAFDDNVPKVIVCARQRRIHVNGAYRHGFLLAPVLARCVAGVLDGSLSEHSLVDFTEPDRPPLRQTDEVL